MWRRIGITVVLFLLIFGQLVQAREYRLDSGDVLSIVIWGQVNQNYSVTVGVDGSFELPLIGKVTAKNKTISELAEELKQLFSIYIKEPNVIVSVTRARNVRIQLVGNVRTPGLYTVAAETTLSQVLALAGGITPRGDAAAVKIQHTSGESLTVDLTPLLTGTGANDMYLEDGDIVIVPLGIISVAVIGEINKPGVYEVPRDAKLMDAIMAAGGITRQGVTSRITIYRADEFFDSKTQPKGEEIFKGNLKENPPLEQGYVIYVPRNLVWDVGLIVSILAALQSVKSLLGF